MKVIENYKFDTITKLESDLLDAVLDFAPGVNRNIMIEVTKEDLDNIIRALNNYKVKYLEDTNNEKITYPIYCSGGFTCSFKIK